MPGQSCPSLALPLGSLCCLWDDVKRNLPLLQLWPWKLCLMEGRGKSIGFSALHTGLNSNANIILAKSDLIFHPPFCHFWVSVSNEHLICSHHIWTAINICCKGSTKGCAAPAPCMLIPVLHVSSTAQHNSLPLLSFQEPKPWKTNAKKVACVFSAVLNLPHCGGRLPKAKSLGCSF